jgi:hypothetical protein
MQDVESVVIQLLKQGVTVLTPGQFHSDAKLFAGVVEFVEELASDGKLHIVDHHRKSQSGHRRVDRVEIRISDREKEALEEE